RGADAGHAAVRPGRGHLGAGAGQGARAAAGRPAAGGHPRRDRPDHGRRGHLTGPGRLGGVTDRTREDTTRRLERAMGALGTAAMARMDEHLPWFRALSAEDRSWVGLVAQAGIAAFVEWFSHAGEDAPTPSIEFFGTAPRELKRSNSLQPAGDIRR